MRAVFINMEDSPWGFEVDVDNVFDIQYKNVNSFNEILISDRNIYLQPELFWLSSLISCKVP